MVDERKDIRNDQSGVDGIELGGRFFVSVRLSTRLTAAREG